MISDQEYEKANPLERGFLWEEEFFGVSSNILPKPVVPRRLHYGKVLKDFLASDYQKVRKWDSSRPNTPLALETFECVQSYLPGYLLGQLRLLCTLGSVLDWHFGIDGILIAGNGLVTFDLAYTGKASGELRADFVISKQDMGIRLWRICRPMARQLAEEHRRKYASIPPPPPIVPRS